MILITQKSRLGREKRKQELQIHILAHSCLSVVFIFITKNFRARLYMLFKMKRFIPKLRCYSIRIKISFQLYNVLKFDVTLS